MSASEIERTLVRLAHEIVEKNDGGANLAGSALSAGIVDRVAFFVAPKILGAGLSAIDGMKSHEVLDALAVTDLSARPVGDDWLLEGRVSARKGRTG